MLVQKQTPERLKKILLYGGIPIVLLGGFVLYNNLSGSKSATPTDTSIPTKTVSQDFGQAIFRDSRFYALTPKKGTELIDQATAAIPATELPAPKVEVFNVQKGGTILFTWKNPAILDATIVRVSKTVGESSENLATMPIAATAFLYTQAVDGQETTYIINYVKQTDTTQSAQVQAKTGASSGGLTVAAADDAGVKLQWTIPATAQEKKAEIYRSDTVGALGRKLEALSAGATNYDDPHGRADLHFYTVVWVGEVIGGIPWTGKVTSTDATAPEAPDFVKTEYDAANELVHITWVPSQSTDVTSYNVYRSDTKLNLGSLVGERLVKDVASVDQETGTVRDCAHELCMEDKKPTAGKTLYYTVVAVDATGNQSSVQNLGVSGRPNPFLPL